MSNGIHESLIPLAVDIDILSPLEGNPRKGNVEAIMASYREFGQIKPIVIRPNSDGTATVIAGNHQLEAARRLGWDKIAAVEYDVDDRRAIAFALADNRTMELGYTEPELLEDAILELSDYYPELMGGLEWDEFIVAEIEQKIIREDNQVVDPSSGYIAPVISSDVVGNGFGSNQQAISSRFDSHDDDDEDDEDEDEEPKPQVITRPLDLNVVEVSKDENGNQQISVRDGVDQHDAIVRGSTVVAPSSAPQAIVQYTLVFDNAEQQKRWYEFIKWLKSDPAIVGSTVGERLLDFIGQHTEV